MALVYETPTALSQFSFIQFKTTMGIADVDEPSYALILKSIFDTLLTQFSIDIDSVTEITYDFTFAIYRHAKFIHEVSKKNLDVINKVADSSGNRTEYKNVIPKEIISTYKMYSPIPPASL